MVINMRIKLKTKNALTGFLFASPSIAGLTVFFIIPFTISIYLSFMQGSFGSGNFVGLKNYIDVFNSPTFRLAAFNTFKFNAVAVPMIMTFSLIVALMLNRKFKGRSLYRTIFIFPLILPVASVILFFRLIFSKNGVINDIFITVGLPVQDWFNSSNAFIVLVILYVWKNCGYNIILFLAALNRIPKEFYEAAETDGANGRIKLFKITLPLIVPHSFFIFIISVINSFKAFREAYILCGTHPHSSIYMLQHFMNNNFQNLNYARLSVGAIFVFVVIFLLIFVMLKLKNKAGDFEL